MSSIGQSTQKFTLRIKVSISEISGPGAITDALPSTPKVLTEITNIQDASSNLNDTVTLALPLVSESLELVSERLLKLLGIADRAAALADRIAEVRLQTRPTLGFR